MPSTRGRGSEVPADAKRELRAVESGSRTVYLVTPVTYEADKADDERVAQAFDRLVKDAAAEGGLEDCGVASVGFSVIQPTGEDIPIGIE